MGSSVSRVKVVSMRASVPSMEMCVSEVVISEVAATMGKKRRATSQTCFILFHFTIMGYINLCPKSLNSPGGFFPVCERRYGCSWSSCLR